MPAKANGRFVIHQNHYKRQAGSIGMANYLRAGFILSVAILMIGLYMAVICAFAPHLSNLGLIDPGVSYFVRTTFPLMALFVGFLSMLALMMSGVADVLSTKNGMEWKIGWTIIILLLGILGLMFYYVMLNEERRIFGMGTRKKK
jgi:hypothetical protein